MNLPDWREWLYSCKAFAAAMLALYLALLLHLPNPYWTFSTVYIVSHPLSGATSSKAIFRVFGTVLGATAGVVAVPLMASTPVLLSCVVALWTGALLYLSLLIRTPTSYAFLLSGYTMPMIAIPSILNPSGVFELGLARTEEIVLGIVCSAVINTVVFPNRIAPVMAAQIGRILRDAAQWAGVVLGSERHPDDDARSSHKLIADVISLDALVVHLSFDSSSAPQAKKARELRERMTMLVPQLSGLLDPLLALEDEQPTRVQHEATELVTRAVAWMKTADRTSDEAPRLRALADDLRQRIGIPSTSQDAWALTVLARLDELVNLWDDCEALQANFSRGGKTASPPMHYVLPAGVGRTHHHDHAMLLYKAASVAVCVASAAILWLNMGWAPGAGGVVNVAVSYCFFAAFDDPAPRIRGFFDWLLVGTVVGFVYLFAILPGIHTFAGLALVFAPPMLIVGAFTGRPQFTGLVMLFMIQSISEIGLRESYSVEFEPFVNTTIGALAGCAYAVVWASVSTPFGVRYLASRLTRANWGDLERAASLTPGREIDRIAARMIDRCGQLLPRLTMLDNVSALRNDAIREIRLCLRLRDLLSTTTQLAPDEQRLVQRVKGELASYFRACRKHGSRVDLPRGLLACIDTALSALLGSEGAGSVRATVDLASLRFAVASDARPVTAGTQSPDIPLIEPQAR